MCIVFLVDQKRSPKLRPCFSLCQFANFSLYSHIIVHVPKGCGRNFGDGTSDHDTRSQGLKGNAHILETIKNSPCHGRVRSFHLPFPFYLPLAFCPLPFSTSHFPSPFVHWPVSTVQWPFSCRARGRPGAMILGNASASPGSRRIFAPLGRFGTHFSMFLTI